MTSLTALRRRKNDTADGAVRADAGGMAKRIDTCRLFLRPIIGGRSRGRLLPRGAFRMARPGLVGLLPWSAFRMPWALGCVWLMARRELGLARAALLCVALGKGRRG